VEIQRTVLQPGATLSVASVLAPTLLVVGGAGAVTFTGAAPSGQDPATGTSVFDTPFGVTNSAPAAVTLPIGMVGPLIDSGATAADGPSTATATAPAPSNPPTTVDPNDPDGDGFDADAEALRGTDPLNPDSDGDGESDGEEVRNGTNPSDPNSNGLGD